jgi:C-terminal peptidase prc
MAIRNLHSLLTSTILGAVLVAGVGLPAFADAPSSAAAPSAAPAAPAVLGTPVSVNPDAKLPDELSAKLCNYYLDSEAALAYDADGIKKLLATARACPTGASLNDTIQYVDGLLVNSFDDPYTVVSPPDAAAAFAQQIAGKAAAFDGGGIGLMLSFDPSKTLPAFPTTGDQHSRLAFTGEILHAFSTGPAAKAGIKDGDVISKVDGKEVIGLDSNFVVENLMRGKVGSKLTVTVMRGKKELTFTMARDKVVADNVWSHDLGNGIYAIIINEFQSNTAGKLLTEMQSLMPKARGFVIDVRGNPGGLLDEAILAASWFVHDGVIISQRERIAGDPADPKYVKITYTRVGSKVVVETVNESTGETHSSNMKLTLARVNERTGKTYGTHVTDDIPFLGYKPTVVLANGGSASAAEAFTGAVSENYIGGKPAVVGKPTKKTDPQGAIFVGSQSFGKFIGQSVMPGPMAVQLKATSFRYFSPKGEWLGDAYKHRIGLTPNVPVAEPDNAMPFMATDAQIQAAIAQIMAATKTK